MCIDTDMPVVPQLRAVGGAMARELTWGLAAVAHEMDLWRAKASAIPTPAIRSDALSSLSRRRGHVTGAALFSIIPRAREPNLLRLLVAYQVMFDFLDCVNEHGAAGGQVNGRQLHRALTDALDPAGPRSAYYSHHPWRDDGGYLDALVSACQDGCRTLPSYEAVRPLLLREARRAEVQAINHEPDPIRRDLALQEFAGREWPARDDASWYELSGAASSSLRLHALLTLAAKPRLEDIEIACVYHAYFPWIDAATSMLDAYVDRAEDLANGDHSYVGHYGGAEATLGRLSVLVRRAFTEAGEVPDGERHVLIVACMVAMYLSKDSAWVPRMRCGTRRLLTAGGHLPAMLLPVLRVWRIAYAQRSA
jgi:tetraprenyl-beta-curcumene synthase